MKRLTALEALGRGLSNVRGNVETVAAAAAGSLGGILLVVLSLLPWLGGAFFAPGGGTGHQQLRPEEILAWMERFVAAPGVLARLGLGLASLFVGLTAASIIYCWAWGGVLAVLHAGDAQAPPGSGRGHELFRIWTGKFYALEAARLTWKLLLYLSFFFTLLLFVFLAFGLLGLAAAVTMGKSGAGAGLALGCGGALPLAFVYFAVSGAMWIGQVELVPAGTTAGTATRAGFVLLGRRLGASVALFALFFALTLVVALFFGGLGFVLQVAFSARPVLAAAVQIALSLVQLLAGSALHVALAASFVALARAERSVPLAGGAGA